MLSSYDRDIQLFRFDLIYCEIGDYHYSVETLCISKYPLKYYLSEQCKLTRIRILIQGPLGKLWESFFTVLLPFSRQQSQHPSRTARRDGPLQWGQTLVLTHPRDLDPNPPRRPSPGSNRWGPSSLSPSARSPASQDGVSEASRTIFKNKLQF